MATNRTPVTPAPLAVERHDATATEVAEYVRVSRIGGRSGEGYISIPEQQRANRTHAASRGLTIVATLVDEDRSGGNLDREAFTRGLAGVREGRYAGIIVATFDRFSRDEADTFTTLREVEDAGGRLWCGDGDVSMATSADALQTGIRTVFNAFERRRKGEGLTAAVRSAISRGVHLAPTFGYVRSNGKSSPLAIEPAEAGAVERMFARRAAGWSWARIADEANALGPLPRARVRRRGEAAEQALWNHKTVRGIVQKRTYLGEAWNGTNADGTPKHVTPNAHPAIVSHDLWSKANETRGTTHARPADGYLLTGLVRCEACGYAMPHARDPRTLADGTERVYRYYRCRPAQHGDGRCPRPATVDAAEAEAFALEAFTTRYLDTRAALVEDDTALADAEAALDRAAARYARAVEQVNDGETSDAVRRVQEASKSKAEAEVRRAEADVHTARAKARGGLLPGDLDADGMASATVPEQRHFLATVFRCVVACGALSDGPVADRVRILGVDQAPDGDALRRFVAGRDWHRPEAGV